jgi:hypothetical protein
MRASSAIHGEAIGTILPRSTLNETSIRKIERLTYSGQVRRIDYNACMASCMLERIPPGEFMP